MGLGGEGHRCQIKNQKGKRKTKKKNQKEKGKLPKGHEYRRLGGLIKTGFLTLHPVRWNVINLNQYFYAFFIQWARKSHECLAYNVNR